jgi:hypothetical protein
LILKKYFLSLGLRHLYAKFQPNPSNDLSVEKKKKHRLVLFPTVKRPLLITSYKILSNLSLERWKKFITEIIEE